jgi:AcrR family transcriptional regulator
MTSPDSPVRTGDATRQRLLRAALDLYAEGGMGELTTPVIARKAGVAEGTIYRHFSGKDLLLNEAYRGAHRWAADVVAEQAAAPGAGAREVLERLGRRLVEAAARDPAALRMLLDGGREAFIDGESRAAARRTREALEQVVARGKSEGTVRAGPVELWAAVWVSVVSLVLDRVCSREWTPNHSLVAPALEAGWAAIAAPSEPLPERS